MSPLGFPRGGSSEGGRSATGGSPQLSCGDDCQCNRFQLPHVLAYPFCTSFQFCKRRVAQWLGCSGSRTRPGFESQPRHPPLFFVFFCLDVGLAQWACREERWAWRPRAAQQASAIFFFSFFFFFFFLFNSNLNLSSN